MGWTFGAAVVCLLAAPPRAPEGLSDEAKAALKRRMVRHAAEVDALVRAVVLLRRSEVQALAEQVAGETRVVPPTPDAEGEAGAPLPARFFSLQDALRLRAGALKKAAAQGSDAELARAFGELTQTCVQCHALLGVKGESADAAGPPAPAARPPR